MIDNLLYAKRPPPLKRPMKLAYLENGTEDQMATQLGRQLEREDTNIDGKLPMLSMTAAVKRDNENITDLCKTSYLYCKTICHLMKDCHKRMRKEQDEKRDPTQYTKNSTPKTYSPCPSFRRTNRPPENCWNGPNATNRSQKFKPHAPIGGKEDVLQKAPLHKPQHCQYLKTFYIYKATTPMEEWNTDEKFRHIRPTKGFLWNTPNSLLLTRIFCPAAADGKNQRCTVNEKGYYEQNLTTSSKRLHSEPHLDR